MTSNEFKRSEQSKRLQHLSIKLRSLQAEAKIIRSVENRAYKRACARHIKKGVGLPIFENYGIWDLRVHRAGLGQLSRLNHLAYGFLRGVSYAAMEAKATVEPNWQSVLEIAMRFYAPASGKKAKECPLFAENWKRWRNGEETDHAARWSVQEQTQAPAAAAK